MTKMKVIYRYTTPDTDFLSDSLRAAIETDEFKNSPLSTVALGDGVYLDLDKAPHVLIAGCTGSGKSVMMHNIIASLLARNNTNTAQFMIIDPKMVEYEYFYKDLPLLYCPIVTDPESADGCLDLAVSEMMHRYDIIKADGERKWNGKKLYIIIDEIADLIDTCGKGLEKTIAKIARLGRGAGIHLIVATQHPTAKVLSRQITTNLDTRICLKVADKSASRLVLSVNGAEELQHKGDAILKHEGTYTTFHGAFLDDDSLKRYSHSWIYEELSRTPIAEASPGILKYLTGNNAQA